MKFNVERMMGESQLINMIRDQSIDVDIVAGTYQTFRVSIKDLYPPLKL